MNLVSVAYPHSEPELAVMLCLLEAYGIPAYVQNGGFGGLHPGPQIAMYNTRRIVVPRAFAEEARDVLAVLERPDESPREPQDSPTPDRWRLVLEFFIFGWFVPGSRRHKMTVETS
ncbi:hypothetical protein EC912_102753 [Luteibacter rhizovicinus]|uniref:Signal transducing protein n=1 Tax=Luteibacter rhizovicinus TaxID=242606 RepID=A0A4R3YV79_9GAMM|nr:hypothetical protein [Luteibacter rhizovicinus]TCV96402.1 hypothetical protein EC912_102753 [Luteibacter rhizovicinus]